MTRTDENTNILIIMKKTVKMSAGVTQSNDSGVFVNKPESSGGY
jgi:hypothetical protein